VRVFALKIWALKAAWSAAAKLPPWNSGKTAAASLPHSKALRAFSWFLGAHLPTGMSNYFVLSNF